MNEREAVPDHVPPPWLEAEAMLETVERSLSASLPADQRSRILDSTFTLLRGIAEDLPDISIEVPDPPSPADLVRVVRTSLQYHREALQRLLVEVVLAHIRMEILRAELNLGPWAI